VRLGSLIRYHLLFVAMNLGWALLYLIGAIDMYAFLLLVVFTSFRVSGTYVLCTVMRRPFNGNDLGVFLFVAAIFAARYAGSTFAVGPLELQHALPYLACLYMGVRNMQDFLRHYPELRPTAK
jgi:hypothetical protein